MGTRSESSCLSNKNEQSILGQKAKAVQLIEVFGKLARRSLEPVMPSPEGKVTSAGTCLYASYLLQQLLERFADCVSIVRGGDGHGDGGIRGCDDVWYGHYWVEGRTFIGKMFVADITADQFGFDPVVVLPLRQARYRYISGAQDDVDRA